MGESRKVVRRQVGGESSRPALVIPGSPFQPGQSRDQPEETGERGSLRTPFAPYGARGVRGARARTLDSRVAPPTSHRIALRHLRPRRHFRSFESERRCSSQRRRRDVTPVRAGVPLTSHLCRSTHTPPRSSPRSPNHATIPSRVRIVYGSRVDCVYI